MQHMLRDPVIQNTRLIHTPETEEEGAGSHNGEGLGEESENPLVGPGITITQPDKIQPIKVYTTCTCYIHTMSYYFLNVIFYFQFGSKKKGNSQDAAASEVCVCMRNHIHMYSEEVDHDFCRMCL